MLSIIVVTSFVLVICDSAAIADNEIQPVSQDGGFLKWSIERCKAADDYNFKVKAFVRFSRWLVRNCKELEAAYVEHYLSPTQRRPTQRPTQRPPAATTQRPPIGGTTARPPIGTPLTTRSTTWNPNQPIFPTSSTDSTQSTTSFPPGNFWPQPQPSASNIQKNVSLSSMIFIILMAKIFA